MARMPILPSNPDDPVGQDRRERAAMNDFAKRLRVIEKGMLRILDRQEYKVVTINSRELSINEKVYRYELDETILANINAEIAILIDSIILEGGLESMWILTAYVQPAYQEGTAKAWTNLSVQSELYANARPTLESILLSPPYQARIGLLKARVFEEMKGLSEVMKSDLGSTLARGMASGQNPRVIAKDIKDRIGVSQSRANRIARTEITTAFKNARLAEDESAREDLGVRTLQMQISALSPTTRQTHRSRHATLHTAQEVREWRSRDANDIQCKCGFVAVLVDENNEPLTPSIIERAKRKLK